MQNLNKALELTDRVPLDLLSHIFLLLGLEREFNED